MCNASRYINCFLCAFLLMCITSPGPSLFLNQSLYSGRLSASTLTVLTNVKCRRFKFVALNVGNDFQKILLLFHSSVVLSFSYPYREDTLTLFFFQKLRKNIFTLTKCTNITVRNHNYIIRNFKYTFLVRYYNKDFPLSFLKFLNASIRLVKLQRSIPASGSSNTSIFAFSRAIKR